MSTITQATIKPNKMEDRRATIEEVGNDDDKHDGTEYGDTGEIMGGNEKENYEAEPSGTYESLGINDNDNDNHDGTKTPLTDENQNQSGKSQKYKFLESKI